MIVSERMPNLRDARGVFDRSFVFTTYKGRPKYDIKETLTPQGIKARQEQLDKLNDFRKLMLIYRLLHFKDPMQEVNVGVEGREKELSKPIIQLYYGTRIQPKIETTLQQFLDLRAEKKEITLEPILYPIVTKLVSKSKDKQVFVKDMWDELHIVVGGNLDEKKPNELHTLDYGTIYNNTISSILENTFGGRPKHTMNGNAYIFDVDELVRVGRAYSNVSTTIQTKLTNNNTIIEESNSTIHEGYEGSKPIREASPIENEKNTSETMTRVVHCRREPYDVYIGREYHKDGVDLQQSKWHNPYIEGRDGTRQEVIEKFRDYIISKKPDLIASLPELKAKVLGCHCSPKPCHGDILIELINNNEEKNNFEEGGASIRGTGAFMPSEILTDEDIRRLLYYGAYWSGSSWHCKHCKYSYDKPGMINHLLSNHNNNNEQKQGGQEQ